MGIGEDILLNFKTRNLPETVSYWKSRVCIVYLQRCTSNDTAALSYVLSFANQENFYV